MDGTSSTSNTNEESIALKNIRKLVNSQKVFERTHKKFPNLKRHTFRSLKLSVSSVGIKVNLKNVKSGLSLVNKTLQHLISNLIQRKTTEWAKQSAELLVERAHKCEQLFPSGEIWIYLDNCENIEDRTAVSEWNSDVLQALNKVVAHAERVKKLVIEDVQDDRRFISKCFWNNWTSDGNKTHAEMIKELGSKAKVQKRKFMSEDSEEEQEEEQEEKKEADKTIVYDLHACSGLPLIEQSHDRSKYGESTARNQVEIKQGKENYNEENDAEKVKKTNKDHNTRTSEKSNTQFEIIDLVSDDDDEVPLNTLSRKNLKTSEEDSENEEEENVEIEEINQDVMNEHTDLPAVKSLYNQFSQNMKEPNDGVESTVRNEVNIEDKPKEMQGDKEKKNDEKERNNSQEDEECTFSDNWENPSTDFDIHCNDPKKWKTVPMMSTISKISASSFPDHVHASCQTVSCNSCCSKVERITVETQTEASWILQGPSPLRSRATTTHSFTNENTPSVVDYEIATPPRTERETLINTSPSIQVDEGKEEAAEIDLPVLQTSSDKQKHIGSRKRSCAKLRINSSPNTSKLSSGPQFFRALSKCDKKGKDFIKLFSKGEEKFLNNGDVDLEVYDNGHGFMKNGMKIDKVYLVKSAGGLEMKAPALEFDNLAEYYNVGNQLLDVIDSAIQGNTEMTLSQLLDAFKSDDRKQFKNIYNVLSQEFSHAKTKLNKEFDLPTVVKMNSIVNMLEEFLKKELINIKIRMRNKNTTPNEKEELRKLKKIYEDQQNSMPKYEKYLLVSMEGSFTDVHVDFSASSVYYHVVKEWKRIEIKEGQTAIIPAGYIHFVYTPEDSIVLGGNFLMEKHAEVQFQVTAFEENELKKEKNPKKRQKKQKYMYQGFRNVMFSYVDHILNPELKSHKDQNSKIPEEDRLMGEICLREMKKGQRFVTWYDARQRKEILEKLGRFLSESVEQSDQPAAPKNAQKRKQETSPSQNEENINTNTPKRTRR